MTLAMRVESSNLYLRVQVLHLFAFHTNTLQADYKKITNQRRLETRDLTFHQVQEVLSRISTGLRNFKAISTVFPHPSQCSGNIGKPRRRITHWRMVSRIKLYNMDTRWACFVTNYRLEFARSQNRYKKSDLLEFRSFVYSYVDSWRKISFSYAISFM